MQCKIMGAREVNSTVCSVSVNHPTYYNYGKIEVIDFIDDQRLSFSLGNAVKYISRAGKKSSLTAIDDLKKASWYIDHEIERLIQDENN